MNLPTLKKDDDKHLSSIQVAKMINKRHDNLVRDIDNYVELLTASTLRALKMPALNKNQPIDTDLFFINAQYKDKKGQVRPCYLISKMGCEFIANKMQGTKGALFTALYVIKFNKLEKIQRDKQSMQWQEARKLSKVYADFINNTIQELVNYSITQGQAPEKAQYNFINYNKLINKVADVYDRNNTDTETQNKIINIIVAVDMYIKNSMRLHNRYYNIYSACKDLINTALKKDMLKLQ